MNNILDPPRPSKIVGGCPLVLDYNGLSSDCRITGKMPENPGLLRHWMACDSNDGAYSVFGGECRCCRA